MYKENTPSSIPIHIITQLWGHEYVNLYGTYVTISLMWHNNLPALSIFKNIIYEIYTTEQDKKLLKKNVNFERMISLTKGWITFRFIIIKNHSDNPYTLMSECHRQAILKAELSHSAIIFLQPDVIVGNGSLQMVREKLLAGKRLIMSPGLRVIKEKMQENLDKFLEIYKNNAPNSRELVSFSVENLHPISKALLWQNEKVHNYCSHLYWKIYNNSLYTRCAHMHPLMVYPKKIACGFDYTIDWDYFYRACPNYKDWFISNNSDEVCLLELSGFSKFEGMENWQPAIPQTLTNFLMVASRLPHLKLLEKYYLFIGSELSKNDWYEYHLEANRIIKQALLSYKSLSNKPQIILIHMKQFIQKMKNSKNIMYVKIFYALRYLLKFEFFTRLKYESCILGNPLRKTFKCTFHEYNSLIVHSITHLKYNFIHSKDIYLSSRKPLNKIFYLSLYHTFKLIFKMKFLKNLTKRTIKTIEFTLHRLKEIIVFITKSKPILAKRVVLITFYLIYILMKFIWKLVKFLSKIPLYISKFLLYFFQPSSKR